MGADYTALAVAVVGVVGTLSAPALSQRAALRAKTAEVEMQRRGQAEERADDQRRAALAEKRELYAELNAKARRYRTATQDSALALQGGADPMLTELEEARRPYRDVYARAQMVLPERAMSVAAQVNLCLGHGYRSVREAAAAATDAESLRRGAVAWLEGPASDAVWLLRMALREDLGVIEPNADLEAAVRRLGEARAAWQADFPGCIAHHPD